ncbi:hypothetical protein BT63DRAFT_441038 [Microthyrium microscopicum]|uniref:Zn(2)-C6 fungal-type domain-containing protein n=1 Tax=Microthyrium microscopicum TaxID=703497 RepID=A0A6A6U4Z4_9PEZI|nr:hypothetical protein BT63DRAFT_441038 [Microthyrium microscopicum]
MDPSQQPIDSKAALSLDLLAAATRETIPTEAGLERRPDQPAPRMRSSIACARCRRSKIKCLNNGVNTPCRGCMVAGRECTYPSPAYKERGHRRDGSIGRSDDLSTPDASRSSRSKPKKSTSQYFGLNQSNRALIDALDPTVLTPQIWLELFEIWQLHFSIDLPFLHPPSFLKLLRQAKGASSASDFSTPKVESQNELPAAPAELLLAFLALTSKFHPGLVAHHSPGSTNRPSNPLLAAEYYATACKAKLTILLDINSPPDLARVQAYLMLAFHEWGNGSSVPSWNYLGQATRFAHLMGLNYQQDIEDSLSKSSVVHHLNPEPAIAQALPGSEDESREQETHRRTFWACFILERCLSSGRFRPLSIRVEDIKIQLPISERAFLFNERVQTPLLSDSVEDLVRSSNGGVQVASPSGQGARGRENMDASTTWETGPYEGLVSRYVKASEIYSAVVHWACQGGRLTERYPPWDTQSTWNSLSRAVQNLTDKLPRDLALSQANISAHITSRTSGPFTLLHTMLLLSKMILHRELIPFLPIRADQPSGPLDDLAPYMKGLPESEGLDFYAESASELFKSARDLLNLYLTCAEWKMLVETPLVGFASYMIAMLGIYSTHFPWMDAKEWMSSSSHSAQTQPAGLGLFAVRDAETARKASDLVSTFRPKLQLADGWYKTLGRLHRLFFRTKKELRKHFKSQLFSANEPNQSRSPSHALRMGHETYQHLDAAFGRDPSPQIEDAVMMDVAESLRDDNGQQASEGALRDSWAAVNALQNHNRNSPPTSNGFASNYQNQTSPSATPNNQHNQPSAYPPISPNAGGQPYTPTQQTNFSQNPYGAPFQPQASPAVHQAEAPQEPPIPKALAQPLTPEQADTWLTSLETVFGANDVAAFVEAVDWKDFASPASPAKGWLRVVWMG